MTPGDTDPLAADDLDRSVSGMLRIRRVVIGVLVTVFLPCRRWRCSPAGPQRGCGLPGPGTAVFIVLVDRWVLVRSPSPLTVRCGTWSCCG
jgi:hypothetical protein